MVINENKTKTTSLESNFPPEVHFQNGQCLELVKKVKLVSFVISEKLRLDENTNYLCEKARIKL